MELTHIGSEVGRTHAVEDTSESFFPGGKVCSRRFTSPGLISGPAEDDLLSPLALGADVE